MSRDFLLVVITAPRDIPGEVEYLGGLLEAGLQRLHLRKPGGSVESLLARLAPRWGSKLVVHGNKGAASGNGVRLHGAMAGAASRSVHSWEEFMALPQGLEYALISPVFDSISKAGYPANRDLLQMPWGPMPCRPVGLGGVSGENIRLMTGRGWTGAAVLGWLWKDPGKAVSRFVQLKHIIDEETENSGPAESIGGSGV